MKVGSVYKWVTTKAKGYDERTKYHVFICEGDWQDGHTFLFISSEDIDVGGDYQITKPPYDFLTKPISFISCSSIVTYTEEELAAMGDPIGQLSVEHLTELHQALANSDTMTAKHIKRCCNAIMDALKT